MRAVSSSSFLFASLLLATAFACGDASDAPPAKKSGLATRPSNKTCIPHDVAELHKAAQFQRAFPALTVDAPMFMAQAPGDATHYFVSERAGKLRRFTGDGADSEVVLDFSNTVNVDGEGGFLQFAFHPQFATNGTIFISYTKKSAGTPGLRSTIAKRVTADGGKTFGEEVELFSFEQPASNHNGGSLAFSKDGLLYVSFGDGGGTGNTYEHGQDTTTFFSKVLRIDVDGGSPYAVPPSNPFVAGGAPPEVYARGFRNPWRISVDRATGDLWVGDVGQGAWEEIDRVVSGANYGWPIREGRNCYGAATCDTTGLTDPVVDLSRDEARSITGGYVYRGTEVPEMAGRYVFGDFATGFVFSLDPALPAVYARVEAPNGGWSSFAEDAAGELYGLDLSGGAIYKLVHVETSVMAPSMPAKLSATGCVDPAAPKNPAAGVIPYDVNVPFWSDGATKERFIALPDGAAISLVDDGDFDLPVGSVAIKNFTVQGKRIETRLFVRHASGDWAGYSYEWDEAETDATLLTEGKTRAVGAANWIYPGPSECMSCHTAAAGRTLGLEALQLRKEFTYPGTEVPTDQIEALAKIGVLATRPTFQDALPHGEGEGTLDARALAYLHTNCSQCHRPEGPGLGNFDMRYRTPLAAKNMCNVTPIAGTFGLADAKVISPGHPESSVVLARMGLRESGQMPPLATNIVDAQGVTLLEEWIRSLSACPTPTP